MWYIIPAFGIGLVFPQRSLAEMALFWALWMHYCLLLSFALLCIFGSDTIHRIINRESFPTSNLDTWKGIFLPWDIYVHSPMERNNKHMLIVCPGIQRSLRVCLCILHLVFHSLWGVCFVFTWVCSLMFLLVTIVLLRYVSVTCEMFLCVIVLTWGCPSVSSRLWIGLHGVEFQFPKFSNSCNSSNFCN